MARFAPFIFWLIQISLLFLGQRYCFAQQAPLYSLYMFDKNLYNPGYIGVYNKRMEINADIRKQYLGYDGGPFTTNISMHAPMGYSRFSIGGKFMTDGMDFMKQNGVWLMGGYKLSIKPIETDINFGLEVGYVLKSIDYSLIRVRTLNDPSLADQNNQGLGNYYLPDLSLGIHIRRKDWYLGGSVKSLFPSRFGNLTYDRSNPARLYRNYFIQGGGTLKIAGKLLFQPSFLMKFLDGGYNQMDLSGGLSYGNLVGIGCTYRTNQTIVPFLSLRIINGLFLHYGFERPLGTLNEAYGAQSNSHEIMLRCIVDTRPSKVRVIDPRYAY